MSGAADVVALLQALVRLRSEDPPGRELEVAHHVHAVLEAAGIETLVDEFAPGRANVVGRVPGR